MIIIFILGDNMNASDIEREIIMFFFKKNRRDRMLFELSNSRKRSQFFWNISGTRELDEHVLRPIKDHNIESINACFRQLCSGNNVYYIGASFIGFCTCTQAIEQVRLADICLVYFGGGKGYYQGEIGVSGQNRFYLLANRTDTI
jgi:hypothetical protein